MASARITAFGVVSLGCPRCDGLKADLERAFGREGYELEFLVAIFDTDPSHAAELAIRHGLDDIPSFSVGDRVFRPGFGDEDVRKAVAGLGRMP